MSTRNLLALLALLAPALPAQMSGNYTINPGQPTGGRNFQTFPDAATALKTQGVTGAVSIRIVPGTHGTGDVVWPIAAGLSATNTVTISSVLPLPGQVKLTGTTHTFTIEGSTASGTPAQMYYIFDNLEFVSASTYAIFSPEYADKFVIRNCIFGPQHGRHLYIQRRAQGVEISRNKMTCPPAPSGTTYGLYMQQIYQSNLFDNEVDLNGCTYGWYFINYNDAQNRVHNNWFYGACKTYALNMGASNYNNHVHNNTFACMITNAMGAAIYSQGFTSANRANEFYDNIVYVVGGGACFRQYPSTTTLWPFTADGNLYWAPGGAIGIDNTNTAHTTLAAWQAATGQDKSSRNLPPSLVSATAPYDLRLTASSAAIDTAIKLPAWITVDHDGEARGAKADVGADELVVRSFGTSCKGTNGLAPEQSSTGFWKPLTGNFRCVLTKAPPATVGVLVFGLSDKQWGPFTLPLALPGGCTLYTSLDLLSGGVTSAGGDLSVPLSLPDLPIVRGLRTYTQFLVADPASPFGWTLSNALSLDS